MDGLKLLLILLVLLCLAGLMYFVFKFHREWMAGLAGELVSNPIQHFVAAYVGVWIAFCVFWLMLIPYWLFVIASISLAQSGGIVLGGVLGSLAVLAALDLAIAGWIGWIRLIAQWRRSRQERAPEPVPPLPRLQWSIQDLFILTGCYGIGMMIVVQGEVARDAAVVAGLAIWLLLGLSAAFFVTFDICRRNTNGTPFIVRSGMQLFFAFLATFTLPIFLLAWWRWRAALDDARRRLAATASSGFQPREE